MPRTAAPRCRRHAPSASARYARPRARARALLSASPQGSRAHCTQLPRRAFRRASKGWLLPKTQPERRKTDVRVGREAPPLLLCLRGVRKACHKSSLEQGLNYAARVSTKTRWTRVPHSFAS
eukprot:3916157-Pleurochrysis_carterae.AAC.1